MTGETRKVTDNQGSVCKVGTQDPENLDEELKPLVTVWSGFVGHRSGSFPHPSAFGPVVTLVVPLSLPSFLRCLRRDCKERKGMEGHDGRPE